MNCDEMENNLKRKCVGRLARSLRDSYKSEDPIEKFIDCWRSNPEALYCLERNEENRAKDAEKFIKEKCAVDESACEGNNEKLREIYNY